MLRDWFSLKDLNPINLKVLGGFLFVILFMSVGMYAGWIYIEKLNRQVGGLEETNKTLVEDNVEYRNSIVYIKQRIVVLEKENKEIRDLQAAQKKSLNALRVEQQKEKELGVSEYQQTINLRFSQRLECLEVASGSTSSTCEGLPK